MKKFLLILVLLTACSAQISFVEINNTSIPVELAQTAEEKTQGLMFRTNLTGGMLFMYDEEKTRQFWMKNTLIPLDIVYINSEKQITTIHHATPCVTDACQIYPGRAQYVLEVNFNFTNENNIQEGDLVIFKQ